MARKPTESEIQNEMTRIGGTGGDFFSAEARLQQKLDKADNFEVALSAVERTAEVATFDNSASWPIEPDEALVKMEMQRGTPHDEAYEKIKSQMIAGAKRLSAFAPEAAEKIQKAVTTANRAAEEAEAVVADQNAAESAVVNRIIQLGNVRRKIEMLKRLDLPAAAEKSLAQTALNYFLLKTESPSVQNESTWATIVEDLVIRLALKPHLIDFIKPLEMQAETIIALVRAQAHLNGIDLKKLMTLLYSERGAHGGVQLSGESNFYAGLL